MEQCKRCRQPSPAAELTAYRGLCELCWLDTSKLADKHRSIVVKNSPPGRTNLPVESPRYANASLAERKRRRAARDLGDQP